MPQKTKPFWYKVFIDRCTKCSHEETWKVRMHGDRPMDKSDRHEHREVVCMQCKFPDMPF